MDIKTLFNLLLKKWWIILATVLVAFVSTLIFTINQTPIYSTTVTYIVSPSPEILNGANFVSGLSVLGAQTTITNTYASIATSASIRENAVKALRLSQRQNLSLDISSRVQSGTNLIEITVEGDNPTLVQSFANEVGQRTLEYVATLYEVYDMKLLDRAGLPEKPIRPKLMMNLALSLVFGLALGGGLALLLAGMSIGQPGSIKQANENVTGLPKTVEDY